MPLWGTAHASATNKPKFLPTDEDSDYERAASYATQQGWAMQAGHISSGNDNTSADVEVLLASRDDVLRIPTSVITDSNKVFVFDEDAGQLTLREIETGISNWEFTWETYFKAILESQLIRKNQL